MRAHSDDATRRRRHYRRVSRRPSPADLSPFSETSGAVSDNRIPPSTTCPGGVKDGKTEREREREKNEKHKPRTATNGAQTPVSSVLPHDVPRPRFKRQLPNRKLPVPAAVAAASPYARRTL